MLVRVVCGAAELKEVSGVPTHPEKRKTDKELDGSWEI
jgi:hypothetical protein